MKPQIIIALAMFTGGLGLSACNRPTTESCEKAIANIRHINGTDKDDIGADPTAAIRSCRGNASKESVTCLRNAKNMEQLQKCEGDIYATLFGDETKNGDKTKPEATEQPAPMPKSGGEAQPARTPGAPVPGAVDKTAAPAPAKANTGAKDDDAKQPGAADKNDQNDKSDESDETGKNAAPAAGVKTAPAPQ